MEKRSLSEKIDKVSCDEEEKRISIQMEEGRLNQHKQSGIEHYTLVDFAARHQKGFRNNVISIEEVPPLVKKYKRFECYTTMFFYNQEILDYMRKNIRNGKASVAGYSGKVWTPFFVMDIDSEKLEEALAVSRELVSYFLQYWDLSQESLLVYFSGSAGFHILVNTRVFGKVEPSESLHLVFSQMRKAVTRQAKIKKTKAIDYAIKDKVRLLRIVNTVNAKSGLYKVQLSLEELFRHNVEDIVNKAKKAQPVYFTDSTGLVSTENEIKESEQAKEVFQRTLRIVENSKIRPVRIDDSLKHTKDPLAMLCEARKRIWQNHIKKGSRNNSAVRLLTQFRLSGFNREKTIKLITAWNERNSVNLPVEELLKSVRSVYDSTYNYGCNDEVLKELCPFSDRRRCKQYRIYVSRTSRQGAEKKENNEF